ncbi:MAG: transposase family protein [Proteobacteria bacterium]|nr:transposase family protein [Pseudomonadota bacterium]
MGGADKGSGDLQDRWNGCVGRSRGGLTSKIHALVDAEGRPVTLRLTGGQVADCTEADALIDDLGEGDILLADKGYDSNAIRAKAAERKAWANIPPKANRKGTLSFSRWVYRQRNLVERFFNRIKQFRGIATRYDKRPENYLAAVKLVAARIWCLSL